MAKFQIDTGKADKTINTNNVWDRIVALENDVSGIPSNVSETLESHASQLAQKLTKGTGEILLADLHTEVKTAMTGGSVAVVGLDSTGTENIKDKAVTPEKASFIDAVYAANMYDPSIQTVDTITDNAVIQNGVIVNGLNSYLVTGKIFVKPSQQYTMSHKIFWDAQSTSRGAMFDKNNNFLGNITDTTFTTLPGTHYIRLTSQKGAMFSLTWLNANFMLVEGTVIPSSYVAYKKTYTISNIVTVPTAPSDSPLYVEKTGDVIHVFSKYSDTHDLMVVLKKRGANTLFDFHSWNLIPNTSNNVSSDISKATLLYTNGTDFFSPYQVKALANINGDLPNSNDFTGGNHEYTNTGSGGTPTARAMSYELFVDGRKVGTNFKGYANYINLRWKNRVQATNTKKVDGTGREVLEETISICFDGLKWSTETQTKALEDIRIEKDFGLCLADLWGNDIIFKGDLIGNQVLKNTDTFSKGTKCTSIVNFGATHSAEFGVEPSFGLSHMTLNKLGASGMQSSYGKTYTVLIYNNTTDNLTAGNMYHFRGYFRFYPTF